MTESKKKGRPKITYIDPQEIEDLAKEGLTVPQIAATVGCCYQTVLNRWREEVERGRAKRDFIKRAERLRNRHTEQTEQTDKGGA